MWKRKMEKQVGYFQKFIEKIRQDRSRCLVLNSVRCLCPICKNTDLISHLLYLELDRNFSRRLCSGCQVSLLCLSRRGKNRKERWLHLRFAKYEHCLNCGYDDGGEFYKKDTL